MSAVCVMLAGFKIKIHSDDATGYVVALVAVLAVVLLRWLIGFVLNSIRKARVRHLNREAAESGGRPQSAYDGCHCVFCGHGDELHDREIVMNNYRSGREKWRVVRIALRCCPSCEKQICREKHRRNVRWTLVAVGIYISVAVMLMLILEDAMRAGCAVMLVFAGVILCALLTAFCKKMGPVERAGVLEHPVVLRLIEEGFMFGKGPAGVKK